MKGLFNFISRLTGNSAKLAVRGVAGAVNVTSDAERVVTGLLTDGARWKTSNPVDAIFPHLKDPWAKVGPKKFGMHPAFFRNVMLAGGVVTVGATVDELGKPMAPPPSIIYDGISIRRTNDMGANSRYASAILGRNNAFGNEMVQSLNMSRILPHLI